METTGRIELVLGMQACFHLSDTVIRNLGISKNYGTSLWDSVPRSEKISPLQVDRVVNNSSSSSTVELVDDTYRTIDESWLFTASRSTVTR